MSSIRLGTWNIEWMNDLFETDGGQVGFKSDGRTVRGPRSGNTVRQRIDDIAGVIDLLALDAVVIVEGPNSIEELQHFFDNAPLQGAWICALQRSPRQSQCVGIALRMDTGLWSNDPILQLDALDNESGAINRASDPFDYDSDDDGLLEKHKFERRPLYVEVRTAGGRRFRVAGLHLKSKGIFTALEWSKWWRQADANRRRLLAQCRRFRDIFLEPYLSDPATRDLPLVVCGDINDGPGFDTSEAKLDASGIETLMGDVWRPDLALGNALFDSLSVKDRAERDFRDLATTRFKDPIFDGAYHNVWIDHILYTRNAAPGWLSDAAVHRNLPDGRAIWRAFPAASDHYPISVTVTL
jgi:endonuclease/exonuclease/phosphatase family metal-dependent hydrolase